MFGSIDSDNSGGFTAEQLKNALNKGGKDLDDDEIELVMTAFEEGLHSSAAQAAKRDAAEEKKRGAGRKADQMLHSAVAAEAGDGTISFEEFIYAIEAATDPPLKASKRSRTQQRLLKSTKKMVAENLQGLTLHVGGLVGDLELMENLIEKFEEYGHVRAVTVRERREAGKVSWGLVTFDEKAAADKALADVKLAQENLKVAPIDVEQAMLSEGKMQQTMSTHKKKLTGGGLAAAVDMGSLKMKMMNMKKKSSTNLLAMAQAAAGGKEQGGDGGDAAAGQDSNADKSASSGALPTGLNVAKTAAMIEAEKEKARRLLNLEQKQKWAVARAEKHEEARAVALSAAEEAERAAQQQAAMAKRREEVAALGATPKEGTHVPLAKPEHAPKEPNKQMSPNEATARNALAFFSPTSFLYTGSSSLPNSPRWAEEPIDTTVPAGSIVAAAASAGTAAGGGARPALQYAGSQSESVLLDASTTRGAGSTPGDRKQRVLGPRLLLELDGRAGGKGTVASPEGKIAGLHLELGVDSGGGNISELHQSAFVDYGVPMRNNSPSSDSELAGYTNGIVSSASTPLARDAPEKDVRYGTAAEVLKWEGEAMFRIMRKAMRLRRRMFTQTLQGTKGTFEAMDLSSSGLLSAAAFTEAMHRLDLGLDEVQISQIFTVLDSRTATEHDGLVEYGDFVVDMHRRLTQTDEARLQAEQAPPTEPVKIVRAVVTDVNVGAGFGSVLTNDSQQRVHFSNSDVGDPNLGLGGKLAKGDLVVCTLVQSPQKKVRAVNVLKLTDAQDIPEPEPEPEPSAVKPRVKIEIPKLQLGGDRVHLGAISWLGDVDDGDDEREEDDEDEYEEEEGEATENSGFRISVDLLAAQDAALKGLEPEPSALESAKPDAAVYSAPRPVQDAALDPALDAAATRIQATQRARISRRELVAQRDQLERAREHRGQERAAVKIQSAQRGKQSRRRVMSVRQQAAAAVAEREAVSATRIQARQRARMSRKMFEEQRVAAVKIQAQQRGKQSRRSVLTLRQQAQAAVAERESLSATRIQSTQRGRMMRRDLLQRRQQLEEAREARRQTSAAIKIQAVQRGQQSRRRAQLQPRTATQMAEYVELGDEYETIDVYPDTNVDVDVEDDGARPSMLDEAERETRRWLGLDSSEEEEESISVDAAPPLVQPEPALHDDAAAVRIQARQRGRLSRRQAAAKRQRETAAAEAAAEPEAEPEPEPEPELEPEPEPSFEYTVTVVPHPQFGLGMTLEAHLSDAIVTSLPTPPVGGCGESERAGVRVGSVVLEVDGRNVRGGGVNATVLAIKMARAGWGGPAPTGPVQIELLLRDTLAEADVHAERAAVAAQRQAELEVRAQEASAVRIQARQRGRKARRDVTTALRQLEEMEEAQEQQDHEAAAGPGADTAADEPPRELSLAEQAEAMIAALDAPTVLDAALLEADGGSAAAAIAADPDTANPEDRGDDDEEVEDEDSEEEAELELAATRIQAAHRGRRSRASSKQLRRQMAQDAAAAQAQAQADAHAEGYAATRIQAVQRGQLARRAQARATAAAQESELTAPPPPPPPPSVTFAPLEADSALPPPPSRGNGVPKGRPIRPRSRAEPAAQPGPVPPPSTDPPPPPPPPAPQEHDATNTQGTDEGGQMELTSESHAAESSAGGEFIPPPPPPAEEGAVEGRRLSRGRGRGRGRPSSQSSPEQSQQPPPPPSADHDNVTRPPPAVPQPAAQHPSHLDAIRAKISAIYELHNPRKLTDIDALLAEWAGEEHELLQQIEQKYGA